VAVNGRGGEIRYDPSALERFQEPSPTPAAVTTEPEKAPGPPSPLAPITIPRQFDSTVVEPEFGESIDSALRRFKKRVERSGLLQSWREHRHFVPRSARRRLKSHRARARRATAESRSSRTALPLNPTPRIFSDAPERKT
jgi:small subunit ribosomal protein S21